MAFMVYSTLDGRVPAWEYYDATGLTPVVGMALKLSGGKLVKCGTTDKPAYICMRTVDRAMVEGDAPVPVVDVEGVVFEVNTAASLAVGATCALAADALSVASGSGAGVVVAVPEDGVVRMKVK